MLVAVRPLFEERAMSTLEEFRRKLQSQLTTVVCAAVDGVGCRSERNRTALQTPAVRRSSQATGAERHLALQHLRHRPRWHRPLVPLRPRALHQQRDLARRAGESRRPATSSLIFRESPRVGTRQALLSAVLASDPCLFDAKSRCWPLFVCNGTGRP